MEEKVQKAYENLTNYTIKATENAILELEKSIHDKANESIKETFLEKKMKPILFNTEMVKAILDGRKTQTIRFIGNRFRITEFLPFNDEEKQNGYKFSILDEKTNSKYDTASLDFFTAYGFSKYKVNDILYVRETFLIGEIETGYDYPDEDDYSIINRRIGNIIYKADHIDNIRYNNMDATDKEERPKWTPSIHMPKEHARIFLKVTKVRVKRLQDISDGDIEKEGILRNFKLETWFIKQKREFINLWNSTAKDGYRWEDNPCVFVYEFERIIK